MSDFRRPWNILRRCPLRLWSSGGNPDRAKVVLNPWEGTGLPQGSVNERERAKDNNHGTAALKGRWLLRAAKGQEEWEDSSDKQYPLNPGPWDFPGKRTEVGCHCRTKKNWDKNF